MTVQCLDASQGFTADLTRWQQDQLRDKLCDDMFGTAESCYMTVLSYHPPLWHSSRVSDQFHNQKDKTAAGLHTCSKIGQPYRYALIRNLNKVATRQSVLSSNVWMLIKGLRLIKLNISNQTRSCFVTCSVICYLKHDWDMSWIMKLLRDSFVLPASTIGHHLRIYTQFYRQKYQMTTGQINMCSKTGKIYRCVLPRISKFVLKALKNIELRADRQLHRTLLAL
jgi:hypothetical protein